MNFLSGLIGPLLGGGGANILESIAKPVLSGLGGLFGSMFKPSTPLGQEAKNVGPTESQWSGYNPFMGAMRRYGNDLGTRVGFTKLMPYTMGNNLGDIYHKGMRYVMNYVRDGNRPDMPQRDPMQEQQQIERQDPQYDDGGGQHRMGAIDDRKYGYQIGQQNRLY